MTETLSADATQVRFLTAVDPQVLFQRRPLRREITLSLKQRRAGHQYVMCCCVTPDLHQMCVCVPVRLHQFSSGVNSGLNLGTGHEIYLSRTDFPQTKQVHFLLPPCVHSMCLFLLPVSLNCLPQISQGKGPEDEKNSTDLSYTPVVTCWCTNRGSVPI